MKHKLLFFTFLAILIGCKKNKKLENDFPNQISNISQKDIITENHKNFEEIKIDLSNIIEGEFDDFFKLKRIINLDNKSLIGTISKIEQYRNNLIVLDKYNAGQIYCYNLKGDLLWEYKSRGGGPLEYKRIWDFVVNEKNKTIDIWDNRGYKIIQIDINTGKPLKYFKLGVYANSMVLYDSNTYLIYTGNLSVSEKLDYKLLLYSPDKGVISRNLVLSENDKKIHWNNFINISKNKQNEIYFTEKFNDTIYQIKNDTLISKYYINFLDKKYPRELRDNYSENEFQRYYKQKPFISAIDFIRRKGNFLNFMFVYKNLFFTVFYDIKQKKTYIFNKLKNGKYSAGKYQQILTQGYIDDGFITFLEPAMFSEIRYQMKTNVKIKEYLIENRPELYKMIINTNDYSNPTLLVYEFNIK